VSLFTAENAESAEMTEGENLSRSEAGWWLPGGDDFPDLCVSPRALR